jgi:hypothetical protein
MEMYAFILMLSSIMWFLIDRLKPLWSELAYGKYITLAVSALLGLGLSLGYKLDIIFAMGLAQEATTIGQILTGLALMSGASAVSEIIAKLKLKI